MIKKYNIHIVAEAIYPRIAPRSFRATELAKAFAKLGHKVTLAASLGDFDYTSFENNNNIEVKDIGTSKFSIRNSNGLIPLPLWKKGLIFLFRKPFDFPDILMARSVNRYVTVQSDFDILITIGSPYAIHWGATLIPSDKRNFSTWISDCGDPFMGNPIYKPFWYFGFIERQWSKKTDYITVPISSAKAGYFPEFANKINIIPQGFDFSEVKLGKFDKTQPICFLYAGMFYPERRDPKFFLEYLSTLEEDFTFYIYTNKPSFVLPYKNKLGDKIIVNEYLPRISLIYKMSKMSFLINIKNEDDVQSPSKLIDYSLAKRPILTISSSFDSNDRKSFIAFLKRNYNNRTVLDNLEKYDSKRIACQFLNLHTSHNAK